MIATLAALALFGAASSAALAMLLRRERALRRAAEARLSQSALAERRIAAAKPVEALAAAWRDACRPPLAALDAATAALIDVRLLADAEAAAEVGVLERLLEDYARHRRGAEGALDSADYVDRDELIEREVALEAEIRPALARVRRRIAEDCRPA